MKVTFKNLIGGYTGCVDGIIFYWDPRLQRMLARAKPRVRIKAHHVNFGNTSRALMALNPAPAFRNDLRSYAERSYSLPEFKGVRPIWNNLYLKIMYGLRRLYPDLDLQSLSRNDINTFDLPCRSVQRAVEAGLLPPVRDWQKLTAEM